MFKLDTKRELGKELRSVVSDTLALLMDEDDKVVALDADLGSASKWLNLKEDHNDRFIDVGISEANMVGTAAGLSLAGFTPFIHTFVPFVARRALDQVFLAGAYSNNKINIFGSDPGFAAGFNGGTHTSYEDISALRAIPNVTICDAADAVQMEWIIKEYSQLGGGVHYVRGNRKDVRNVYQSGSEFEIGKGNVLREGSDYLIIAAGQLVSEALDVADLLEKDGINSTVIDMFTIKPLDADLVLQHLSGKKRLITIENHNINGGLGSAVAEVAAESGQGVPLTRIGNPDRFGQVGTPQFLQEEYGLTTEKIYQQIMKTAD